MKHWVLSSALYGIFHGYMDLGMISHICNPNTQEVEEVQGQPGLLKTLSQEKELGGAFVVFP